MNTIAVAKEGVRILKHSIACRRHGPRRYKGDAQKICKQIVDNCWNGTIFRTSLNNYPIFYARDFGMCVDSLLQIGYKEEVKKTLYHCMEAYANAGKITQQINGEPFSFPNCEQPDAYAFLLHALQALNDKKLIKKYETFLKEQLQAFLLRVENADGSIKNIRMAGMRDHAIRQASCYDATMVAAVHTYGYRLKLLPEPKHNYQKLLEQMYWTGTYFKDDINNGGATGDANVVPFWFDIVDRKLWKTTLQTMRQRKLDKPLPLRYEPHVNKEREMIWVDALTDGWEHDTVWLHLGNLFLQVVARHDKKLAMKYLEQHRKLIEKLHHYPEVLTKEGKPHSSWFFHSDDSMLWAANYLALSQTLERTFGKRDA